MSGPAFTPRHSCGGKKRIVPREKCKACIRGIPLPGERAAAPKEVLHFCRFTTAMCGLIAPKGRVQQDRLVTCEGCLLKRLAILGMPVAERALNRLSNDPAERLALLRRAVENVSRLRLWMNAPEGRRLARRRAG